MSQELGWGEGFDKVANFFVEELKEKLPEKFIPSHLFQVLHVGVGRASGAVPFNTKTINNCMIRWGKVKRLTQTKATIKLNSLTTNRKNQYKLIKIEETVPYDNRLKNNLKTM